MTHPSLKNTKEVFIKRAKEVREHLDFVKGLIESKADALAKRKSDGFVIIEEVKIDRGFVKSLTATGYLLIYNLIESTMTNALDAVHRQLREDGIKFKQLNESLKRVCFKTFKSSLTAEHASDHGASQLEEIVTWIGYNRRSLFNGNIDADEIHRKSREYGFLVAEHDRRLSKDGKGLRRIRIKRNELAHGEISFSECGHETSIDELIALLDEVEIYLDAVIKGIEEFLVDKGYLIDEAS